MNGPPRFYKPINTKNGKTYDEFKLVYYDAEGKRRFETFSDFNNARARANFVISQDGIALLEQFAERRQRTVM